MKNTIPDTRAQEKASKEAREKELFEALDEALGCEKCQIAVAKDIMAIDINNGNYNVKHYPPFFQSNVINDEGISPFDTSEECNDQTYWKHISQLQRQRYYEIVEQNLNKVLDQTKEMDPETALLFAHYQLDYHIRQHYLARRGVLALCRDTADLQQLRRWQWKMSDIDSAILSKPAEIELTGARQWGWPSDQNLEMTHQHIMWKRLSRARLKRVREVRARWAIIMEERRKQRELLLLKQGATLTVRLYCRGELWDIRTLKNFVYPVPITPIVPNVRVGRVTRSMGL
ncbi:hypothetical protein N7448_000100 [Penicillium atrosanguineum]|uniref:Uncharacterized protein n=1 Tax=Penicillium atrosanguineum TaxID=1132637 RepID=A0A9W9HHD0_9EURO|nr:hypothetical protein N7526_006242 [Penicillium atrosanguineum]KAJ5148522.1 hypothetical protein N7448_000100 [Penicillium atrosanguineum]KAJ5323316.1 hypothetical protein N7476_001916 [Penicillium atrosanguineum]